MREKMWRQNMRTRQLATAGAEFRQCFKCNYEAVSAQPVCPRCRCPKFLTAANIRTRGMVMVGVGLFLALFMGVIGIGIFLLFAGAMKDPASAKRIAGNQGLFLFIFMGAIFAGVIAFGVNSIVGGLWMLAFGKRNRVFVWLMWAILVLILIVGGIFEGLAN